MGKYWVGFTYDMDLLGNSLMGFIMIFWGGLVVAWRRGGAFCKALGARLPGGDSLWSPNGVAEIMQDTKPVRLPGGGLLFYEEK